MGTEHAGLDRLARLADFLEKEVDPKSYDMRRYSNTVSTSDPSFVGCALGHATRLFVEEKFELVNLGADDFPYHTTRWGNLLAGMACQEFFGITGNTQRNLFGQPRHDEGNPTPADTAAKIRDYIRSVAPEEGLECQTTRAPHAGTS